MQLQTLKLFLIFSKYTSSSRAGTGNDQNAKTIIIGRTGVKGLHIKLKMVRHTSGLD